MKQLFKTWISWATASLLMGLILFIACSKSGSTTADNSGGTSDFGDNYVSYTGANQAMVKQLLNNVKGWKTNSSVTTSDGTPPDVKVNGNCIRDTYVAAAVKYAWAAEAYYRLGNKPQAENSAAQMQTSLSYADAECGPATINSGSCATMNIYGCSGGGNTVGKGQLMFWAASDLGCGAITVTCNNSSSSISGYYAAAPACGASNSANFSLAPGTYNYSASCSGGLTWSGTASVTANGCSKIQLIKSGGSNGGGFHAQVAVTFWIASDLGCGQITVNCGGTSQKITTYNSSGAPACGASGAATFLLPTSQSTYNYTASCSGGRTWSGSVTVSPFSSDPDCIKVQLR